MIKSKKIYNVYHKTYDENVRLAGLMPILAKRKK